MLKTVKYLIGSGRDVNLQGDLILSAPANLAAFGGTIQAAVGGRFSDGRSDSTPENGKRYRCRARRAGFV